MGGIALIVLFSAWAAVPYIANEGSRTAASPQAPAQSPAPEHYRAPEDLRQQQPSPPPSAEKPGQTQSYPAWPQSDKPAPMQSEAADDTRQPSPFSDSGSAFTRYLADRLYLAYLVLDFPEEMMSTCREFHLSSSAEAALSSAADPELRRKIEAMTNHDVGIVRNCSDGQLAPGEAYLAFYEGDSIELEREILTRLGVLGFGLAPTTGANSDLIETFTEGLLTVKGGTPAPPRIKDVRLESCDIMRVPYSSNTLTLYYRGTLTGGLGYYFNGHNKSGDDREFSGSGQLDIGGMEGLVPVATPPLSVFVGDSSIVLEMPDLLVDLESCVDVSF